MIYINITNFVLISKLEKDHSMIETHHLKMLLFFSKQFVNGGRYQNTLLF